MKYFFIITIVVFSLTISSCGTGNKELQGIGDLKTKKLGHCSVRILIEGYTKDKVKIFFGVPDRIVKKNFLKTTNGYPAKLPEFDEQWVYVGKSGMEHTLIFIKNSKVVLAVRECSSY